MARTVDPARHRARREQIIDAAITCFSRRGYDGTSTADLCRQAGIGSGTFFHYFPTKRSLLLALLDLGAEDTRSWFAERPADEDPRATVDAYVDHVADEYDDPRTAGLVRALGAVVGESEVDAALARDADAARQGLRRALAAAQALGRVRDDRSAEDLARWVQVLLDGFAAQLVDDDFTVAGQREMLTQSVDRLLAPGTPAP